MSNAVTKAVERLDGFAQLGGAFLDPVFEITRVMAQFCLGQRQVALGFLLLGNVARDLGSADDSASGVLDGRDGEGNVNQRLIFAAANGLIMGVQFATADTFEQLALFVRPVRRR